MGFSVFEINFNWKDFIKECTKIPKSLAVALTIVLTVGGMYFGFGKMYGITPEEIDKIQSEITDINRRIDFTITPEENSEEIAYLTARVHLIEQMTKNYFDLNDIEMEMILTILETRHYDHDMEVFARQFRSIHERSLDNKRRIYQQLDLLDDPSSKSDK